MWNDEDVDHALAWQAEQDGKCVGCGHPRDESFDPKGPNYEAEVRVCTACAVVQSKGREYQKDPIGAPPGTYIGAVESTAAHSEDGDLDGRADRYRALKSHQRSLSKGDARVGGGHVERHEATPGPAGSVG